VSTLASVGYLVKVCAGFGFVEHDSFSARLAKGGQSLPVVLGSAEVEPEAEQVLIWRYGFLYFRVTIASALRHPFVDPGIVLVEERFAKDTQGEYCFHCLDSSDG
jgi:hypothetical protein